MSRFIEKLNLPEDLKALTPAQLEQVCCELRDELINTVSSSGGHFASSLGATEISVALHYVFNTPHDRLVWDVGHQGYIHKMLTGRRAKMHTIRQAGGVCGFLTRQESEYDCFGAGHAGTSISAALGMCAGLAKTDPTRKVVAIIGDGSITSGMAFEALNHAGSLGHNLIVVLNDNEMSISPNVGALSWLFSKTITSRYSTKARATFKELYQKGYVPNFVYHTLDRAEEATQGFLASPTKFFSSPAMLFESFGFRYIGPVDGHNINEVIGSLERAKQQDVPVLLHCYTTKGKGYEPAEEDPVKWHGVTPFVPTEAKFISFPTPKKLPSYTQVFAQALSELAQVNPKIVGITAAMASGTGLDKFEAAHPDKFYDVAICEQHAVTFAAGLACEGYRPVCAIYSTFLQRAYDQVVHDVCIQNLPVVFAMDRGGVVGNDGHTHQGVFDISYLRCIPNMVIAAPKDENELRHMLYTGIEHSGPFALRYPRGNAVGVEIDSEFKVLPIGKAEILVEGSDALIIGLGPMVHELADLARALMKESGISITVINARYAKPLDCELLCSELPKYPIICTVEDHAISGGFGSAILELVNDFAIKLQTPIKRFGVSDNFVAHASQSEQHKAQGYDIQAISKFICDKLTPKVVAVNQ